MITTSDGQPFNCVYQYDLMTFFKPIMENQLDTFNRGVGLYIYVKKYSK